MKLIIDSCSVILLGKATVLEVAINTYDISITEEVYKEVIAGKKKMLEDALLLDRLKNENKIKIIEADKKLTKKIAEDFNMGLGESSAIAISLKEKNVVITDNRQGRKIAKINNLQLVGSIDLIISLFKKNKITNNKARSALSVLQEEGWFSPYLIEHALEELK